MIHKKSKVQGVDHRLIMAWVRGERADLTLTVPDILERYTPPDLKGSAQYFTSVETGMAALARLRLVLPARGQKLRVLEPCAGIGHFIHLIGCLRKFLVVDAYEVEAECVEIGRKLFPWVNWQTAMPFLAMADIEGRYDLVLCNPPIGSRRGMNLARPANEGRYTRSEYVFLDVAVRALKAGGQIVYLAPETFMERRPTRLQAWMKDRVELADRFGPLPGPPASINLYAHYFRHVSEPPGGADGHPVALQSIHFKQLYQKGDFLDEYTA